MVRKGGGKKESKKPIRKLTKKEIKNSKWLFIGYSILFIIGLTLFLSKRIDSLLFLYSMLSGALLDILFMLLFFPTARKEYFDFFSGKIDKKKIGEMLLYLAFIIFIFAIIYLLFLIIKQTMVSNFAGEFLRPLLIFFIVIVFMIFELGYIISQRYPYLNQYVTVLLFFLIFLLYFLGIKSFWFVIFVCVGYLILTLPQLYNLWQKPKWLILLTILLILIFVTLGLYFIDSLYGNHTHIIFLNDCYTGNRYNITLNCTSINDEIIADYKTSCGLNQNFTNLSGKIIFYLPDGTNNTQHFKDEIKFLPLSNMTYIDFRICASDNQNKTMCMASGVEGLDKNYNRFFPTLEEKKSNKERFITYLIGLLAIAFFSIPAMIVNFKELSKEK